MIRFKYNGPTSEQEKEGKSSKHGDILSNSGQESKAYSLHASKGRFGTSSNFSFQTALHGDKQCYGLHTYEIEIAEKTQN
jgi:hypothetical protein